MARLRPLMRKVQPLLRTVPEPSPPAPRKNPMPWLTDAVRRLATCVRSSACDAPAPRRRRSWPTSSAAAESGPAAPGDGRRDAVRRAPAIATLTSFTKILTALRKRSRWPRALTAGRRSLNKLGLNPGPGTHQLNHCVQAPRNPGPGETRREGSDIRRRRALESAYIISTKRKDDDGELGLSAA